MDINELYLRTAFCCMACDGNIAEDEVNLVKDFVCNCNYFNGIDVEKEINKYINDINSEGDAFIKSYLVTLSNMNLTEDQELDIIKISINMIEADKIIEYSEVKFFKKIRKLLKVSDEAILLMFPDKEDFLLPDIEKDDYVFHSEKSFNPVKLIFEK